VIEDYPRQWPLGPSMPPGNRIEGHQIPWKFKFFSGIKSGLSPL